MGSHSNCVTIAVVSIRDPYLLDQFTNALNRTIEPVALHCFCQVSNCCKIFSFPTTLFGCRVNPDSCGWHPLSRGRWCANNGMIQPSWWTVGHGLGPWVWEYDEHEAANRFISQIHWKVNIESLIQLTNHSLTGTHAPTWVTMRTSVFKHSLAAGH